MGIRVQRRRAVRLSHLVGEEGFTDQSEVLALALSTGILMDRKGDVGGETEEVDPASLPNWPLLQVIAYRSSPDIRDMEGMCRFLEPYLAGGADLILEAVGRRTGPDAIAALREFVPP